jgi:hypothetical protein
MAKIISLWQAALAEIILASFSRLKLFLSALAVRNNLSHEP